MVNGVGGDEVNHLLLNLRSYDLVSSRVQNKSLSLKRKVFVCPKEKDGIKDANVMKRVWEHPFPRTYNEIDKQSRSSNNKE
jgi:hypothetical protein